jgi:hypothetical protein
VQTTLWKRYQNQKQPSLVQFQIIQLSQTNGFMNNTNLITVSQCVPAPAFSMTAALLPAFQTVSAEDVINAIRQLPDKFCASDPVPTYLLKAVSCYVAAFLAELFNRSLQSGRVPVSFKAAYITPLIKKPDLDASDVRSYRLISNLSVESKLLERLVARQFIAYMK